MNLNPSYVGPRHDILNLIPSKAKRILDIGCSNGALGEKVKQKRKVEFVGIEINEQMAKEAQKKLDRVIVGDIEQIDFSAYFPFGYFYCIVFADSLEHLRNPWEVLKKSVDFLDTNGVIIASIPNVRHYSTILSLTIRGYWPYRERGIHDINHLRFFTLKNIEEMFQNAKLKIIKIKRKYRIIERGHPLNRFSTCFALPLIKDLITFQYLIVAKKHRNLL